jgi:hypothetical protein
MSTAEAVQQWSDILRARTRLDAACIAIATILDAGERDPTWHETQELEAAAIELGRLLK